MPTNELRPLVGVKRLGNRVAINILGAAAIDGLAELAAHNNTRRGRPRPGLAAGVGAQLPHRLHRMATISNRCAPIAAFELTGTRLDAAAAIVPFTG